MFRYKQLIFAVLLTGCTTQAGETTHLPLELPIKPTKFHPNDDLLATVEATLDVADEAIEEILEEKVKTKNKISTLQHTVDYEESLLENLEGSLGTKDSLLLAYQSTNSTLGKKIQEIENNLNHALHRCSNECYPTIIKLNQENQDLLYSIDSLQTWVSHLDSLISTNKRLSKKLNK